MLEKARYTIVPRSPRPARSAPTRSLAAIETAALPIPAPALAPAPTVNLAKTAKEDQAYGRYLTEVFLVSLALGYLFDVLFYGHALGISVPIYATLFLTGLLATMHMRGLPLAWRNLWLLAPLLFFAAMVPMRANAHLTALNVGMTLVLTALLVFFVAAGRSWEPNILGYPVAVGTVAKEMLFAPVPAIGTARRVRAMGGGGKGFNFVPLLRGLVLALPVLILFGALLASADRYFAQIISDLFRINSIDNFGETMWRIVLILTVAWAVAGALLFASLRGSDREDTRVASRLHFRPRVGATEGATVLGLVNVLFAAFAWVQFANIFFGRPSTIDYEGYRDYVRRGFGELLVVCVLTLLLILMVRRLADFSAPRSLLLYKGLSTLTVLFTGVMLVSANERMKVWQEVMFYINTPLRIYVAVFIVWLAALFGWLLLTVWSGRVRFGVGALLAAVGFLATVNTINPDANVAAYNLALQDELSTRYLHLLSDDAVPVLVRGYETMPDPVVKEQLRLHLVQRLTWMEMERPRQSWPAFHFSRSEAYDALQSINVEGKLRPPYPWSSSVRYQ
jgi:hypothetical protein